MKSLLAFWTYSYSGSIVEAPTLNNTQSEIANQTSINGNFDLLRLIIFSKNHYRGGKFDPPVVWRLVLQLSRLPYALPWVSIVMRLAGAIKILIEIKASSCDTNIVLAQLVLRNMLALFAATKVCDLFIGHDTVTQLKRIAKKNAGGSSNWSSLNILIRYR